MKKTLIIIFSILALLLFFYWLLPKNNIKPLKKISEYRQKLRDILNNQDEKQRLKELKQLAKEVGAGYVNTKIAGISTVPNNMGLARPKYENHITESELVLNINDALQTETMINVCEIAARNFWFAMLAALAAVVSALAAWLKTPKRYSEDF